MKTNAVWDPQPQYDMVKQPDGSYMLAEKQKSYQFKSLYDKLLEKK